MKKNKSNKLKLTSAEMESAGIRSAVMLLDAAHTLSSPLLRSIENLLQVSADAVNASEGSVIVRDGNKGALRFLSAIGPVADKLLKVKIPPGKGIAGFVYSSGQPMTVTNAAEEESFYAEVDKTTGYTTQSLLATPLKIRNEVIGVLELLNRPGPPPFDPFTPAEMDQAAHFADAIATLVDAHENAMLIESVLRRPPEDRDKIKTGEELKGIRRMLKSARSAPEHRDMLEMALSLAEIANAGDAERELCIEILAALQKWTEKRSATDYEYSFS